jgi:putative colanic acid biosynthesis UDP-glucose lipid carrier transferase
VKHDLFYIEHWSVWFDLRIVLTTLLKIFFSRKAW